MAAMIKPPAVITPKHATVELWPTSGSTVFAGGAAGFEASFGGPMDLLDSLVDYIACHTVIELLTVSAIGCDANHPGFKGFPRLRLDRDPLRPC